MPLNVYEIDPRSGRRTMYFVSSFLSILSLLAFATFNYIVANKVLHPDIETGVNDIKLFTFVMFVIS